MMADGQISAKCWRCGKYGIHSGGKPSAFALKEPKKKYHSYDIPSDIEYDWGHIPVKVVTYLNKHGFSNATTAHYGIGWSPDSERLIFPARNLHNPDPGWQGKAWDFEPRYLTRTRSPSEMYTHLLSDLRGGPVVVVEDMLSAIRVRSKVLSSFSLLGTELSDCGLHELSTFHREFYVWLDNDSTLVCKKAQKVANRLALFGGTVRLIRTTKEPKECSEDEVLRILMAAGLKPADNLIQLD
jgi:hypothetical protein